MKAKLHLSVVAEINLTFDLPTSFVGVSVAVGPPVNDLIEM